MGYQTISLKGDGHKFSFSIFKIEYEIFSYNVKLSSTLVPKIKK